MEENDVEIKIKMMEDGKIQEASLKRNVGDYITWPDILDMAIDCLKSLTFNIPENTEVLLELMREGKYSDLLKAYNEYLEEEKD